MNIEGLDYNTQREKLLMPEYGREIQNMVDHAVSIPDKEERQRLRRDYRPADGKQEPTGTGGGKF